MEALRRDLRICSLFFWRTSEFLVCSPIDLVTSTTFRDESLCAFINCGVPPGQPKVGKVLRQLVPAEFTGALRIPVRLDRQSWLSFPPRPETTSTGPSSRAQCPLAIDQKRVAGTQAAQTQPQATSTAPVPIQMRMVLQRQRRRWGRGGLREALPLPGYHLGECEALK